MTSREERIALMNLAELSADELPDADDETLVAALHGAVRSARALDKATARIITVLKQRYSWSELVEMTGFKQTTLHNWMHPRESLKRKDVPVPDAAEPEHQPVVAAIVTSPLGVLAGRRRDNKPPWTFIAGEIEPGESAVDAAVREVKEETGLEVSAGHQEIGRRVHPATKRTMIYLACTPVAGSDLSIFVGDAVELSEVRWLNLREVDELLKGIYKPVRNHLGRVIS